MIRSSPRVHAQAAAPDAAAELRLVSALLAESSTIPGEPGDNNTLVDQVQLWTSKLTGAPPATGWQLTFELIEPPDEDPTEQSQPGTPAPGQSENTEDDTRPWQVTFELHSLDDGKSIDAGQIWTDASPLSALGRLQGELRAVLAAELKRAVEFFCLWKGCSRSPRRPKSSCPPLKRNNSCGSGHCS